MRALGQYLKSFGREYPKLFTIALVFVVATNTYGQVCPDHHDASLPGNGYDPQNWSLEMKALVNIKIYLSTNNSGQRSYAPGSGVLLSNRNYDGRILVLTAFHLLDQDEDHVLDQNELNKLNYSIFSFDHESTSPVEIEGATLIAAAPDDEYYLEGDMVLLEIDQSKFSSNDLARLYWAPLSAYIPYFQEQTTFFHFPNGTDDLKVSITNNVPTNVNGIEYQFEDSDWSLGDGSEGGSSGGPYFSNYLEIVGACCTPQIQGRVVYGHHRGGTVVNGCDDPSIFIMTKDYFQHQYENYSTIYQEIFINNVSLPLAGYLHDGAHILHGDYEFYHLQVNDGALLKITDQATCSGCVINSKKIVVEDGASLLLYPGSDGSKTTIQVPDNNPGSPQRLAPDFTNQYSKSSLSNDLTSLIADEESNKRVRIQPYPNPSTPDEINILLENYTSEKVELQIISAEGKLIYESKNVAIDNSSIHIDHGLGLKSGLYHLLLTLEGNVYSRKFIID